MLLRVLPRAAAAPVGLWELMLVSPGLVLSARRTPPQHVAGRVAVPSEPQLLFLFVIAVYILMSVRQRYMEDQPIVDTSHTLFMDSEAEAEDTRMASQSMSQDSQRAESHRTAVRSSTMFTPNADGFRFKSDSERFSCGHLCVVIWFRCRFYFVFGIL